MMISRQEHISCTICLLWGDSSGGSHCSDWQRYRSHYQRQGVRPRLNYPKCLKLVSHDLREYKRKCPSKWWCELFPSRKSGPLFTKRTDVSPQDFVKSRSCEIRIYSFSIALKFDRHLGSSAEKMSAKFQGDTIIMQPKSRGFETSRHLVVRRFTA